VKELAALPGVVAVRPLQLVKPDNLRGIPLIGARPSGKTSGCTGEGVKIAIIDTGIDYTHANFGGPGTGRGLHRGTRDGDFGGRPGAVRSETRRESRAALISSATAITPIRAHRLSSRFRTRIRNPLDCNGHGSHVPAPPPAPGSPRPAATYTGPYNAATLATPSSFSVGPGVAPKADLYAVRVFGCAGSTDVVVDAIDWAVDNDMDVINMSLGSSFGSKDDPSAVASTNAAKAGVSSSHRPAQRLQPVHHRLAGNRGGRHSVAANDPYPNFPGATLTFSGTTIPAINANGFALSGTSTFNVKVIKDVAGSESLGCSVAAFGGPLPPNTIAVVNRGVCARVAKAIFGQQAGAAVVVMVNNAAGFPPFEGRSRPTRTMASL